MDGYLSVHSWLILLPEDRQSMSKQRLCRPCCCTGELIRYTRLRNYCALTEPSLWFLLTEEFQNSRLAFSSPRLYETSPIFLYGTQTCLSQFIFWPHLPLTRISFSGRGFTVSLIVLHIKLITFRVKKIIMEDVKISFVTFLSEAILTFQSLSRMRDKLSG